MYEEFGHTWAKGFDGYSTDQLLTFPKSDDGTGGPSPPLSEDKQGKLFVNLYLAAYARGWSYTQIFLLRDTKAFPGGGLYPSDNSPKLAETSLHNGPRRWPCAVHPGSVELYDYTGGSYGA